MWEAFLEEGKIILSDLPQSRDLRSLNRLIRFYLSIEDGECQVEPDLGVLSKFQEVHKNGKDELDDHLMLVATDPTDVDDIWISGKMTPLGQASSFSRLGLKGRRWAELWRQTFFGVRLGIYKKATESKAEKKAKRPGTYSAAQCGVLLAAAEYAVELSEQDSQRAPFWG